MASTLVLVWVSSVLALVTANVVTSIGVNWGNNCSNNLHPEIVVQLLKDNGVDKVKFFDVDPTNVKGFSKSGIEVMVGIHNSRLDELGKNYEKAKDWVKENVTAYANDGGVDIRYVAVGNEAFSGDFQGQFQDTLLPAMKNIQKALNEAGHGDKIKATTPINGDVCVTDNGLPSGGDFRSDVKDSMVDIVSWFGTNKSPFIVNIHPFLNLYQNPNFSIDFAFFDGFATPLADKGNKYDNMFDANIDTLVTAIKRAGVPELEIMVGEIGWPTDGNMHANETMAQKFYNGFLKKLASGKGTYLYPRPLTVYLFSLLDENLKSILPGSFERHWGIFRHDGQPKFPIDLTGQGRPNFPVPAKGVEYISPLWCIFNDKVHDTSKLQANVDLACQVADCTPLMNGSSCSDLPHQWNVSYAFNIYYQMNNQNGEACIFNGYATLMAVLPPALIPGYNGRCKFPIQIKDTVGPMSVVGGPSGGGAGGKTNTGSRQNIMFGLVVAGFSLIMLAFF